MFTLTTRKDRAAFRAAMDADAWADAMVLHARITATEARIDRVALVGKWVAITAATLPFVHVITLTLA